MRLRVKGTPQESWPLRRIATLGNGEAVVLTVWHYSAKCTVELECGHTKIVPWPVDEARLRVRRRCRLCARHADSNSADGSDRG